MKLHNEQIAAISVFGAYKNENKDAYDVIADFTKAAIAIKKDVEVTPEIVQEHLKELYSLSIPISIIRGVLKNRLKDVALKTNGVYLINELPKDDISSQIKELLNAYSIILSGLNHFLSENLTNYSTRKYNEDYIVNQFAKYIIDDYADEELTPYFSAFIISKKDEDGFRSYFDRFAAGLISYYGLQYFDDANNIGSWPNNCKLTIFLDTEFLFDCAGYNDSYYKKIFDEFNALVKEINKQEKNKPVIELKCLAETISSFDRVINTAKSIIEKKQAPDPSKEAILKIVRESEDGLDADTHRATILAEAKKSNISIDINDYTYFTTDPKYIILGKEEHEKYLDDNSAKNLDNIEAKIDYYSKVLTIINGLRRGVSKTSFENCRYILLSNSRIVHRISYDLAKKNINAVPLATDIDWLVSRFWYKLNKSFTSTRIPLSLDIVARSQASLSEDVCALIKKRFDDIKKKNLPDDVKQELYAGIRTIPKEIELYNSTNLPEILDFISYDDTEAFITAQYKLKMAASLSEANERKARRSIEELEQERIEKKRAYEEIAILKREKRHNRHQQIIPRIKFFFISFNTLYWIGFTALVTFFIFLEYKSFDIANIWRSVLTIVIELSSIITYFKFFHSKISGHITKRAIISRVYRGKNTKD